MHNFKAKSGTLILFPERVIRRQKYTRDAGPKTGLPLKNSWLFLIRLNIRIMLVSHIGL